MRMRRIGFFVLCACVAWGCEESPIESAPSQPGPVAPWQRSEGRAPCASYDELRTPYFGDLHVHTRYSADAYIFGTRGEPRDAYRFAQGDSIAVSDDNEAQTRQVRLHRPLDFAAVTDHAEFYGEVQLCTTPGLLLYDEQMCQILRQADDPNERFLVGVSWLFPAGIENPPRSHFFCELPGVDCDAAAVSVWQDIQAAAEEFYDRSERCGFTTFIGYEHTASPLGRHLHRNVIFRNHHVPAFASSQLETFQDGIPQGLWKAVERDCLDAGTGCDALIIPHNSNLSEGRQWLDPSDVNEAQRRQEREPLVEIHQMKGNSECRFDRLAQQGVQTEDELCTFEQLRNPHEGPDAEPLPVSTYPARNLVRNALKQGLALEETLGVNPFQLGFIGSTDTHNATAGNIEESPWEGGQGNSDSSDARLISNDLRNNPGGLAVAWAEENSRDAIFAALERRETYATSGTRPIVRFFAGVLDGVDCSQRDFIAAAYRGGTPMGGELGPVRGGDSPRFAVLAAKDPGTNDAPGTDLQRVQVVKGWVGDDGMAHERVFDVAGNGENGAGVDPETCAPVGSGARELCTVWEDPEFDRAERAFYYLRVLENPTCRWSAIVCKNAGVDPFAPDCAAQAARAGNEFADCCVTEDDDASLARVIQERAWTSPIWYRPEGIAAVRGGVQYGETPGADVLDLEIDLGRLPEQFGADVDAIRISITDDDEIFALQIPPGSVGTALPGIASLTLATAPDGSATLALVTDPADFSRADRVDHSVTINLDLGEVRLKYTRTWRVIEDRLGPVS